MICLVSAGRRTSSRSSLADVAMGPPPPSPSVETHAERSLGGRYTYLILRRESSHTRFWTAPPHGLERAPSGHVPPAMMRVWSAFGCKGVRQVGANGVEP